MENKILGFRGAHSYLSNFYDSPIVLALHGSPPYLEFPTAEHAYQAHKTKVSSEIKRIVNAPTPAKAKRLGRRATLFPGFEEQKIEIMKKIVYEKFRQNTDLKSRLLLTGTATIIEENNWGDTFWGTCSGRGENMLGKILMEVRKKVRWAR